MATKPKTHILDNDGETFDRYTVVIDNSVFGMSENPLSPNGFNQYSGDIVDLNFSSVAQFIEHMEEMGSEIINIKDLDSDVIKAIREREDDVRYGYQE